MFEKKATEPYIQISHFFVIVVVVVFYNIENMFSKVPSLHDSCKNVNKALAFLQLLLFVVGCCDLSSLMHYN